MIVKTQLFLYYQLRIITLWRFGR